MSQPPIEEEPPVIPGRADAPVSGDRVDLHEGPIVAGDPEGARVEVTETGLRAYDGTGTETASIAGEGGEFVGGEFRTSDALPGQVTLSDTASQGGPGLSIEPEDSTGYDLLPSIGSAEDSMHIRGGVGTDGSMSGAAFRPEGLELYRNGPGEDGDGAWIDVTGTQVSLIHRPDRTDPHRESAVRIRSGAAQIYGDDAGGNGHISADQYGSRVGWSDPNRPSNSGYTSLISADAQGAAVRWSPHDDLGTRVRAASDGIWIESTVDPGSASYIRSYNLLETAQDSGWQPITVGAGVTASSNIAWRNKGGMIYFRGSVQASWSGGWDAVATLPPEARPNSTFVVLAAVAGGGTRIRMTSAGALDIDAADAGESAFFLTTLSYPLG